MRLTYTTGMKQPAIIGKQNQRQHWDAIITLRWPETVEVMHIQTDDTMTSLELLPHVHEAVRETYNDLGQPVHYAIKAGPRGSLIHE